MSGICWLVGAGAFTARELKPEQGDIVIAADGGLKSLNDAGIKADMLIGDFDSLRAPVPEDIPVLRYPVEKDDTDMGIAMQESYERGFRSFKLYGGGGGRIDHLIANIQLMCRYSRLGCRVRLVDVNSDIYTVTDGRLVLPIRKKSTLVSVFCNGDSATGVTLEGLKYPLNDATLACDRPLGVSNEYAADGTASVSVEKGTLFLMVNLD